MVFLSPLLRSGDVEQHGQTFSSVYVDGDGLVEVHVQTQVAGGFVVAQRIRTEDVTYPARWWTLRITYGDFGTSPPIVIPPRSEIVPCPSGVIEYSSASSAATCAPPGTGSFVIC
jgi:hypothetical protein